MHGHGHNSLVASPVKPFFGQDAQATRANYLLVKALRDCDGDGNRDPILLLLVLCVRSKGCRVTVTVFVQSKISNKLLYAIRQSKCLYPVLCYVTVTVTVTLRMVTVTVTNKWYRQVAKVTQGQSSNW